MPDCRMAERCRSRDPVTLTPAGDIGRGLCLACERHGQHAIRELPQLWRSLASQLATGGGRGLTGTPTARAEAPIPLRLPVDDLMRNIAWTLVVWELPVRERAQLADVAERRVRDRVAVARAANVLVEHYSALLALPPIDHMRYDGVIVGATDDGAPDGVDAVCELASLHARARTMAGETRRWEQRKLPCPENDGGCGLPELGRWIGDDTITCANCGWACTMDQYTSHILPLISRKMQIA